MDTLNDSIREYLNETDRFPGKSGAVKYMVKKLNGLTEYPNKQVSKSDILKQLRVIKKKANDTHIELVGRIMEAFERG